MKSFVLLLMIGAGAAASASGELLRLEQSLDAMGSVFSVVVYGEDRPRMLAAVDEAFEEVRRLDRMLSNYKPDSELSRVNQAAADHPVEVSTELFRLLEACQTYSRESEGAFDITVGPLMKIWGFFKGSGRMPHRAEVRATLAWVGYQKLLLDPASRSVRFAREGMGLDPGGIGKGYAVDRMVAILKNAGIQSAFISAGQSSLYAIGAPPGEAGWKVSIRHPRDPSLGIETVVLKDLSMSTSGTSEKFFRLGRQIYSHIMDPRTGFPAQGMLSVSVIAPETIDSEAWTKPVFINGRKWTAQYLKTDSQRPTPRMKDFRFFLCEDKKGGSDQACAWLQ